MNTKSEQLGVLFSETFDVDPVDIEEYGAIDISLVGDLPLFIDPFLLFHSDKSEYQELHNQIIRYLKFLRQKATSGKLTDGELKSWFYFTEVKQTWLGFSFDGNSGSGLGKKFANALNANFYRLLDPNQTSITKDYHLEKLCLIADGVGKDRISDFTTNLILGYLCEYTQTFSRKYIDTDHRRIKSVRKAHFDYKTEAWVTRKFDLPVVNGDFVLLVPADILARDDTWINNSDLSDQFDHLPSSLSDEELRAQVNNYFMSLFPEDKEPSAKERREAIRETLLEFPILIDYYIKLKEDTGERAKSISSEDVDEARKFFLENAKELALALVSSGFADSPGDSYENALVRAKYLKHVIEDQDGYRVFYDKGELLPRRESDVQFFFKLTFFGTNFDVNAEVNNGRGPVDFKVSWGSMDKSLIEFKLARNKKLRQNLEKQLAIYERANQTNKSIKVIVYFTAVEEERLYQTLKELDMIDAENIVLIDARDDNKPSGSIA
jgi:hypothetical protein